MTTTIQVLSDDLINKIAAGEVVERPAAALKEIVENALDAGATHIQMQTEGGGLHLIQVRDNGCGMSPADALLAVQRHATSKIRQLADLEQIGTLGFRGEALPSIAAVSHFTLLTRTSAEEAGTLLTLEAGNKTHQESAAPLGTTVTVRDLFYNTPARLKFMRSERSENMAILKVAEHLALTAPQVAFELVQDHRRTFYTPGNAKMEELLLSLWGPEEGRLGIPIAATKDEVTLTGYIAPPTAAKGTRSHCHLIINNRYVQSRSLQHALEEGFRHLLPVKRYPMAVISLTLPHHMVDVNVHPTKAEVQLHNERLVYQMLLEAVRQGLTTPLPPSSSQHTVVAEQGSAALSWRGEQAQLATSLGELPSSFTGSTARKNISSDLAQVASPVSPGVTPPLAKPHPSPSLPESRGESIFPPLRIISQLAGTFILAQSSRGWFIFDQHAAHERILYQEMVKNLEQEALATQLLLHPVTLSLTGEEEHLLEEYQEQLVKLGFTLEPFGERTFLLRGIPHILGDQSGKEAVQDILATLAEEGSSGGPLSLVEKALISLSCHGAIKANTWLPMTQMEELVQQLGTTPYATTCPHGRPTHRLISLEELDKWFLR
ncbi:MAG: DNA mismatch repair endonuclease MutL [Symbiobacteriaceae bacterium]|nr:DNA mismatch repair endonuclease MutL [Symbiobacteriaceae bacterium]